MPARQLFIAAAILLLLAVPAQAQKHSVSVSHDNDDIVGVQIAHELKELLRGSHGFKLEDLRTSRFEIILITIDPAVELQKKGHQAAFALVVNEIGVYLTSRVGVYGREKAATAAKVIMAVLEQAVQQALEAKPAPISTQRERV